MPVNTTPATAIPLTLPASVTVDLFDAIGTGLWYSLSITTAVNPVYLGARVLPNPPDNAAVLSAYLGILLAPISTFDNPMLIDQTEPMQVPVHLGNTYYFKFISVGSPSVGTFATFTLMAPSAVDAPSGSIVVPDDGFTFPAVLMDQVTGEVLRVFPYPAGEHGDILPDGSTCTEARDVGGIVQSVQVFDPNFNFVANIPNLSSTFFQAISADQVDTFYVGPIKVAVNPKIIRAVSSSGSVSGTTWSIAADSMGAMSVGHGGGTLYWAAEGSGDSAIHRLDLGTDLPLSDLVATVAGYSATELMVLSDGSILVVYFKDGSDRTTDFVRQYNSSGSTLRTYATGSLIAGHSLDHIARDPGGAGSFWVWFQTIASSSQSVFVRLSTSSGAVLSQTPSIDNFEHGFSADPTLQDFGPSNSCPFYLLTQDVSGCVPVTISSQPSSLTIAAGDSAVLTVTAVGTAPITYQWYQGASGDTSNPVLGATSETFETPVLTVTTSYWVRVTNACGSEDSVGATVTVPAPPEPPTLPLSRTLLFDIKASRWFADCYPSRVLTRLWEPGAGVHDQILGHADGTVDVFGGHQDQGADIPYLFEPPDVDAGDPRRDKVFGDAFVSADPKGGPGFIVIPGYNDYQTLLTTQLLGAGLSGRQPIILDINGGDGQLARNFGITITGSDSVGPVFFLWEPAFVPKVEVSEGRSTDWENCGMDGAKFLQGVIFQASTEGQDKRVVVQYGTQFSEVITINDTIESQVPYSFVDPFVAHLVRIVSVDETPWHYYGAIWRFQPFPELVSVYQTPPTTKDFPGYSQDERALIGHISTVDFDLVVMAGTQTFTYRIPHSNGVYQKTPILFQPNKALWYSYACRVVGGSQTLRLFLQDCEIRSRAWGSPSGYAPLRIFGEQSREGSAARI